MGEENTFHLPITYRFQDRLYIPYIHQPTILTVLIRQNESVGSKDGIEGELIIVSPANQEWILSYLVPQSISDKIELSMSYGKNYDWSYKERYKCFDR